jgi:hypothetical protein
VAGDRLFFREDDSMKTLFRLLVPSAAVFALALVQCGGSDDTTPASVTGGAAGFAGVSATGGNTAATGGAFGTGGGTATGGAFGTGGSTAAGGASGTGGSMATGGSAGTGGFGAFDAGANCPAATPADGDSCTGNANCVYTGAFCRCRNGNWSCNTFNFDGGFQFDAGNTGRDAGNTGRDSGAAAADGSANNPAACPGTEPQAGSNCTRPEGGMLTCDYGTGRNATTCRCGNNGWTCF